MRKLTSHAVAGVTLATALLPIAPAFAAGNTTSAAERSAEMARASCRSAGAARQSPGKVKTVGVGGQIGIEGSGHVRLRGSFMSWGSLQQDMTIRVVDHAGDGVLRVGKSCVTLRPTRRGTRVAVLRSPRQRFMLDGSNMRVDIIGDGFMCIAVTGSGKGELNGVGTFTVNQGEKKSWPLEPIDLALAPAT
jgi:hypothetical protein